MVTFFVGEFMLLSEANLPQFITKQYSKYIKLNADARNKRASNVSFIEQSVYNDEDGAIWLNVKNKDFYTIAAAIITGLVDSNRLDITQDKLLSIFESKTALLEFLKQNDEAAFNVKHIYDFLQQFMSKGLITVYRGLVIDDNELSNFIQKDPRIKYNPARILQYIDNRSKEFTSFTVSYDVAYDYAHPETYEQDEETGELVDVDTSDVKFIVFSAKVDNNDVNWAFSAYLAARHGGTHDMELNVNNLKQLKNVKLLDYNL